eukprot:s39_g34.t1
MPRPSRGVLVSRGEPVPSGSSDPEEGCNWGQPWRRLRGAGKHIAQSLDRWEFTFCRHFLKKLQVSERFTASRVRCEFSRICAEGNQQRMWCLDQASCRQIRVVYAELQAFCEEVVCCNS